MGRPVRGLTPFKWSDLKHGFDHGGEKEWLGNGIVPQWGNGEVWVKSTIGRRLTLDDC